MKRTLRKVQLFHTCLINEFYPEVGMSVVDVLEHLGIDVDVPAGQVCCGQPAFNAGFQTEARKVAKYNIEMLAKTAEPIIIPSGSCTHMITHNYPIMFRDDSAFLPLVMSVVDRCYEFTQFIVDVLGKTDLKARFRKKAVYHPSCHLSRELGIKNQPIVLLENVKGIELREFPEQEECCGFGGVFSVKQPEISGYLLQRKMHNLESSGAKLVIGCDMGCLMHIEGGLHRKKSNMKVQHIAQVLSAGLR